MRASIKKTKKAAVKWARQQLKKNPAPIEVGKRFGIGAQLVVEKQLGLTWTPDDEEEPE